ncbi:probable cytochrome P450 28a5 isoform X1 [Bradysia coprophila]|uniref:probable cytochrome P450 28a5 isoform X1 n=2 Tax=Bradysia coprophila TaxID=38358 RepID=UPI00187D81F1|nr:probable cytochrome P450 28a5 isoform X1 [Bradysia coprophila]XP_037035007.1 probable cytochrome P450 28a5 isoform X1 [Bradysia coprophila]
MDLMQKMYSVLDKIMSLIAELFQRRFFQLAAKYAVDVVASCIYGVDSKAFSDEESDIRKAGSTIFEPDAKFIIYFLLVFMFPFIAKIYRMPFVTKGTQDFFTKLKEDAIRLREEQKIERNDYLNYLLQLKKKKNLPDIDVVAHTTTFLLYGFETSSITISHMLYYLAANKSVQNRLRKEIYDNIGKNGRIEFDVLNDMKYMDQVFHETLRKNPPNGIAAKVCTISTNLTDYEGNAVPIEKGMVVQIPTYCFHHDDRIYSNPEVFNPDRFSSENGGLKAYKDKGAFLGFLDGPRQCFGMRFAMAQSKAAVAEILKKIEVIVNAKTQEPLVLDPKAFLLVPVGGLWLNLRAL